MTPRPSSSREASALGRRCAASRVRTGGVALCILQGLTLLFVLAFVGRQVTARALALVTSAAPATVSATVEGTGTQLHDLGSTIVIDDGGSTIEVEEDDDDDDESSGPSHAPSPTRQAAIALGSPRAECKAAATVATLVGCDRLRPGLPRGPPRA